jgi:hypothetical protein
LEGALASGIPVFEAKAGQNRIASMNSDKPDSTQVDGEIVDLWIRKTGASYQVRGTFRNRAIVGKGSSSSAAKSDWIRQADYEARQ